MDTQDSESGISVLLPTNRYTPWLDEAVDSLLSQRDVNIEIVVILDGIDLPGGETWRDDPRVTLVRNPESRGLAAALNLGAQAARFQYLGRLDADDIAEPLRLSKQLSALNGDPQLVMVGTEAILINEVGEPIGRRQRHDFTDLRSRLRLRNCFIHPSVAVRRSAFQKAGGYNESCKQMEDYELWLRLALLGSVKNIPEPLTLYRIHDGQMSLGALPWGAHIRAVLAARRRLASAQGASLARQRLYDMMWIGAQYKRIGLSWIQNASRGRQNL